MSASAYAAATRRIAARYATSSRVSSRSLTNDNIGRGRVDLNASDVSRMTIAPPTNALPVGEKFRPAMAYLTRADRTQVPGSDVKNRQNRQTHDTAFSHVAGTRRRRNFVSNLTRRCAGAAAAAALLLGACGADRNGPASEAFGGLSDSDMTVIRDFGQDASRSAATQADLATAESNQDVPGMRAAVDRMRARIDQMKTHALNADNGELRTTLQDYSRAMGGLVAAFDRYVAYYENPDGVADEALETRLAADIEATAAIAEKADQDYLNRVLDAASPEQRDRLRDQYAELADRYQQAP